MYKTSNFNHSLSFSLESENITEKIMFSAETQQPPHVPQPTGISECGSATAKAPEPLTRSEVPASDIRPGWSKIGSFYLPAAMALVSRAKVSFDFSCN